MWAVILLLTGMSSSKLAYTQANLSFEIKIKFDKLETFMMLCTIIKIIIPKLIINLNEMWFVCQNNFSFLISCSAWNSIWPFEINWSMLTLLIKGKINIFLEQKILREKNPAFTRITRILEHSCMKKDCQTNNCETLLRSSFIDIFLFVEKIKLIQTHASQRQMFPQVLEYEKYYHILSDNLLDLMVFSHIYIISLAYSVRIFAAYLHYDFIQ